MKNPQVYSLPRITNLPKFECKRFRSYEEMNDWKEWMIDKLGVSPWVVHCLYRVELYLRTVSGRGRMEQVIEIFNANKIRYLVIGGGKRFVSK